MIVPVDKIQRFKLSESFINEYKDREVPWGFGPVSHVVHARTYARPIKDRLEKWFETCRRVIEGMFTVQKAHCKNMGLPWDNRKAQRSAQEAYDRLFNFKWTPPGRGLWAMGADFVYEKGGAALNNPLHEDTKILTKEYGWVELKEINGQQVNVLTSSKDYGANAAETSNNPNASAAKWAKADISDFDIQPCVKITMRDKHSNVQTITSSMNHRWFRKKTTKHDWERVEARDLSEGDYIPIVKPARNYKRCNIAVLHGMFFGDGTRSNGELHLFGEKSKFAEENCPGFLEDSHHDGARVIRQCPLDWGKLPETEDARYILGFLAGYIATDGTVRDSGRVQISSVRPDELEAVREMFWEIGVRTSDITVSIPDDSPNNFVENRKALYVLSITAADLDEDFFVREDQLKIWKAADVKTRRDYYKVVSIQDGGMNRVMCATVPGYEQFVTEGFALTGNCGFTSTKDIDVDFARPFCWQFTMSMLGVGVGFDTRGEGKISIHEPKRSEEVFVIPDSREGWAEALNRLLTAFTGKGFIPVFDYSEIRPEGTPIKGFGGIASGPGPLREMLESVDELLSNNVGEDITSEMIVDVMNMVGRCVVSGGVRRTAQISLGNPNDESFMRLKEDAFKTDEEGNYINPESGWRWASNNSIFAELGMDYSFPAELTAKNGEPGYAWLENMQKYGRMIDPPNWKDRRAMGGNPCLEQTLEDAELCCLVETFPAKHDDLDDYLRTLKFAYMYAKTVTLIPTHDEKTNAVMMRNRRIGCSQSGIAQNVERRGLNEHIKWCDTAYNYIQELDDIYSQWLCIPRSIKTTSVKPSGTVSLLAGSTPGIHFGYAEYYIRRIRINRNSPIWKICKDAGYHVEEAVNEPNTMVVEFLIHDPFFEKGEADASIWEQVSLAAIHQEYWADNQVSCTVKFQPHEAGQIKTVLEHFQHRLKGISFLPYSDHGYTQAPYEKITKEEYEDRMNGVKDINLDILTDHEQDDKFCDGDACVMPQFADTDDQPAIINLKK